MVGGEDAALERGLLVDSLVDYGCQVPFDARQLLASFQREDDASRSRILGKGHVRST